MGSLSPTWQGKRTCFASGIFGSEVGRPASATRTSQRSYCDTDAVQPKVRTDVLLLPITWNLPTSPRRGSMPTIERGGWRGCLHPRSFSRLRCTRGLSEWGEPSSDAQMRLDSPRPFIDGPVDGPNTSALARYVWRCRKATDAVPNAVPFVLFCFDDGEKKRELNFSPTVRPTENNSGLDYSLHPPPLSPKSGTPRFTRISIQRLSTRFLTTFINGGGDRKWFAGSSLSKPNLATMVGFGFLLLKRPQATWTERAKRELSEKALQKNRKWR